MDAERDDAALGPAAAPWGDVQTAVDDEVQVTVEAGLKEAGAEHERLAGADAGEGARDAAEDAAAEDAAADAAEAPRGETRTPAAPSAPRVRCTLDVPALGEAVRHEQVDLFLLDWLTTAEQILATDRRESAAFVDEALRLCGARRTEHPSVLDTIAPGRGARQLLARCLVRIYGDEGAEKPPLYDTITALHDAIVREPVHADTLVRHVAALDVCATLLRAFPSAAVRSHAVLVPVCVRLARAGAAPVLARDAALQLLDAMLAHGGVGSLAPPAVKELYKLLRAQLGDRAGPVVRASCACLGSLAVQHDALRARAEIEAVVAQCARVLPASDVATRAALAQLVAQLLLQTELVPVAAAGGGSGPAGADDADDAAASKGPVAAPLYAPDEMLQVVYAHVARVGTPWSARVVLLELYAALLARAGAAWVEAHYDAVLVHLVDGVAQRACAVLAPAEALAVRHGVRVLLHTYLCAGLPEPAQERAAVAVGAAVLNTWPPRTPQSAPAGDAALGAALELGAALVAALGGLARPVHDAQYEPVLTLLTHPARAVQVRAAWWLRVACDVHPVLLAPTYTRLLQYVRRDVAALRTPQHDGGVGLRARLAGHSGALAALVPVAAAQPLYALNEDAEEVFALATELLQGVAEHSPGEAAAAIGAAWTLLGSLFALGPLLARPHWPRLLPLWRNALAAPPAGAPRDEGAWAFLLGVRENALTALLAFFLHGGGAAVLTGEGARRVVGMLSNVLVLLDAFPAALDAVPLLRERAARVRALLLRCCAQLAHDAALAPLHAALTRLALHVFAQPERFAGSAAQAAISTSSGAYTSLWTLGDQYAYGVTSLVRAPADGRAGGAVALAAWEPRGVPAAYAPGHALRDAQLYGVGAALEALVQTPVHGALEYEPGALYVAPVREAADAWAPEPPAPVPAGTAEVDAGIELFAALLAFLARDAQVAAVEYVAHAATRAPALEKNAARRAAVLANSVVALLGALRTAMHAANAPRRPAGFANDRVTNGVRALAEAALVQGDARLRAGAAEVYGRLAAVAGSHALAAQVQFVVAQIVDNRHAEARASCAYAAGEVYARVGGLAAAPLTKTVGRLLRSLARDPHPAVHCAALDALQRVVDAASLGYQPYVPSTLALLGALCALPTHEPEGGSAGSSNLRAALPAYSGVARVAGALVGVLGADLRESAARRTPLYALLAALAHDRGAGALCAADAVRGLQRLGLVMPEALETRAWAALLAATLQRPPGAAQPLLLLPRTAAGAYYQMAQRGPDWLAAHGGSQLLHALFVQLDRAPALGELRALLLAWLQPSAPARPCAWVDLCGTLLLAPETFAAAAAGARAAAAPAADAGAEEGAALAASGGEDEGAAGARALTGWRTRLFVLECLHAVLRAVRGTRHVGAHADASDASSLASRVGELIKMAFAASTATSRAVRRAGLQVLRDVLEAYAATRDPAFPESRLLEQFQAPLAAALTPAFAADSFPDVLASAIAVCAVYLSAGGVAQEAPQTNRIVRLLLAALDESRAQPMTRLGDLAPLAPNAAAYLQVAVLHAWAKLAIAAREPGAASLDAVLAPHRAALATRWSDALVEYAVLREDAGAALPARADGALAELVAQQRLACYAEAWPALLHALALELERGAGAATPAGAAPPHVPALALYALALETLCRELERGAHADRGALAVVLVSLPVLTHARYAGEALAQPALFDELLRVAQRAFLTADVRVALGVLHVLHGLAHSMHERLLEDAEGCVDDRHFAQTPLGCLVRLLLAYAEQIPAMHGTLADKTALHTAAWTTVAALVQVCTPDVRGALLATVLHTLAALARREDEAAALLGPTLVALLRPLCAAACRVADAPLRTAVHGFLCALLETADAMRTRAGAVAERKSRNALVGVGLVLTSLDARLPVSVEVVDTYGYLLAAKLRGDAGVAVQCIATLLPAAAALRSVRLALGAVLPAFVAHVAALAHAVAPTSDTAPLAHAVDVLCALPGAVPDTTAALCIVLPVLAEVLARVAGERTHAALHEQVCAHLVRTAHAHPAALKAATGGLPDAARGVLQQALRHAMGLAHGPRAAPRSEARIALKTFGS